MPDSLFSRIPVLNRMFRSSSTGKAPSPQSKAGIAGRAAEAVEPTFPRRSTQQGSVGFIAFLSRVCNAVMSCFARRAPKPDEAAKNDAPHAPGGRSRTDDEIWSDVSEPEEEAAAGSRSGNRQSAGASRSAAGGETGDSPLGWGPTRPWTMPKKYQQSVVSLEELEPKSPFDKKQIQLLQKAVAKALEKWEKEARNDKLLDDAASGASEASEASEASDVNVETGGAAAGGPAPEHAPANVNVVYAHTGQSEKICLWLKDTLARSMPAEPFNPEKLYGPYGVHTILAHHNGYTMDPTWKTLLLAGCSGSVLTQRKAALEKFPSLMEGTPESVCAEVSFACGQLGMTDDERTSVTSYYVDLL